VEEETTTDDAAPPADPGGLEAYLGNPEPSNVLVLVATDVNRSTRLGKSLDKLAVTVECDGFSTEGFDGAQTALRKAMQFAADRAKAAGKRIDAPGLTALVERAGPDIMRLRKDIDTLVLFVGEAAAITAQDVRQVVGAAQQFDDWAITNAIAAGDAAVALRHVQLMIENGSSPFQMLGQLGWWVRSRMTQAAPERVGSAVRALFQADAASKLGRDPQVVLERLVVELCGPRLRRKAP
jgi:DNA polymerase-3 subunit delta